MKGSLTACILNYLQSIDININRSQSKSLLGIKILLFASVPLLVGSQMIAAIASPAAIAQVTTGSGINRPTLKVGSQGERVSELQAALKLLGFYSGTVDGIYNENTASAVSRFQQAAGLNPDGIVDTNTWQRLFPNGPMMASTVSSPQPPSNSTNFPVPTQTNNVTRVANTTSEPKPTNPKPAATQVVNTRPQPKPTNPKPAQTPVSNTRPQPKPNTPKKATTPVSNTNPEPRPSSPRQTTTSRTQKTPSRNTSSTRTTSTTRPSLTPPTVRKPGIQYTAAGWPILRVGMRGAEVVKLQERLKRLGLLKDSVDGDFGATTEAAVKAVQRRYGLEADGVAGGETWEILARPSSVRR
ncbi:MAG: peptidoglycan-binding protein [Desmonostoc vinosum HA7617-LM4]|jgi:peptidoglycan hydrolase-like protein with peptidoglycan-binding domain|nr:peptidoglycan-binding protein [Desmonostoc vinosum HA7617-LM4]